MNIATYASSLHMILEDEFQLLHNIYALFMHMSLLYTVHRKAYYRQDPASLRASPSKPLHIQAPKRDPFIIIFDWFLYRVHNGVGRLCFFLKSFHFCLIFSFFSPLFFDILLLCITTLCPQKRR